MSDLPVTGGISNTGGFSRPQSRGLEFDGALMLVKDGKRIVAAGLGELYDHPRQVIKATLPMKLADVVGAVDSLIQVWHAAVVHLEVPSGRGRKHIRPFQLPLEPGTPREKYIDEAGRKLAVAGAKLFWRLFGSDDTDSGEDSDLRRLRRVLESGLRGNSLNFRFLADDVFVPWHMLYTHPDSTQELEPDGSNFQWRGFWGYSHVLDHEASSAPASLGLTLDSTMRLAVGVQFDQGLMKSEPRSAIARFQALLEQRRLSIRQCTHKTDLAIMMEQGCSDQALYFFCHGGENAATNEPGLILSDGDPITASDISYWLRKRAFETRPIVLLNACRGGSGRTRFFTTAAASFLSAHASGVIGPTTDVPTETAAYFGQEFFRRFVGMEGATSFAGPIVRDIARDLLHTYHDPMGIAYGAFRGAGCFVHSTA